MNHLNPIVGRCSPHFYSQDSKNASKKGYILDIPVLFNIHPLEKLLKSDDFFESIRNEDKKGFYDSIKGVNNSIEEREKNHSEIREQLPEMLQEAENVLVFPDFSFGMPRQPAMR